MPNIDENFNLSSVLYEKEDLCASENKKVITLGAIWIDDTLKKQVIEFNKQSNEYRIVIRDYSDEEEPITKMNADIVAGNILDIICLNAMSFKKYISNGALENLMPYFDADEYISTEDIVDSVYNVWASEDDKIYYIAPSFDIFTLVAKVSDVGEDIGWTFDELRTILEKKGEGTRPFYTENKLEMLYSFLVNSVDEYVDWETGECKFNSKEFKDILEICNMGTNEYVVYDETLPTLIQQEKVLLVEDWILPEHIQLYRKMFGEDISYIGYPNQEKNGSYFQFYSQLAISSTSEEKEGAWKFIRSFMTKEYQANTSNIQNIPTRKDCFDMMLKTKMTTEMYVDEFGQEIYPIEAELAYDELEVKINPLSQEEVDVFIELVNNTKKVGVSDTIMLKIILEEADAYFMKEKSLNKTVEIIQNRIKTYVNENR